MSEPTKYPDVRVQLTGQDGNVFAIISSVGRALKRAGHPDAAAEFSRRAMASSSYDEVLNLAMDTVTVE